MNWLQADVQIKRLKKGIISVELDLPLFMQWTAAELSQWKWMLLEAHSFQHNVAATMIG